MTDRHAGYIVTLKKPMREDDAQALITAIKMLAPVATVEPITNTPEISMAVDKARWDIRQILWDALSKFDREKYDR